MLKRLNRYPLLAVACLLFVLSVLGWIVYTKVSALAARMQYVDPDFDARVGRPAYTSGHPVVCVDEAHNNFHTAGGRYKPFADLLASDGYRVVPGRGKFRRETLGGCRVLVVAGALGAWYPFLPGSGKAAFTEEECDDVREWVRGGGSLLLVTDHAPAGSASESLARRFGVEPSNVYLFDTAHAERGPGAQDSWVVYSRETGMLADHAVTRGRDDGERVRSVTTFTGQSLKGGEGSIALLRLTETAGDYDPSTGEETSAAGRAQGLALEFGRGRVLILGEAAMLTAQVTDGGRLKFGMQRAGNDNRQFALNVMHWLSRLLD